MTHPEKLAAVVVIAATCLVALRMMLTFLRGSWLSGNEAMNLRSEMLTMDKTIADLAAKLTQLVNRIR